jgi:L-ascorbate metabolism protein UlaG (beta-lactamase superfamily)
MHRRVVDPEALGRALGKITLITSSHGHTDHLDAQTLRPLVGSATVEGLLAPRAIAPLVRERIGEPPAGMRLALLNHGESWTAGELQVAAVASAHDQLDRDAAGNCLYLGYTLRVGGKTIYHSGDTVVYDGLAEHVRALGSIDLAILPINGKVGNMDGRDAARLAKDFGAKLVIPCHYDMFEFNTADPREEFVPECERIGQAYRVLQLGERFTL